MKKLFKKFSLSLRLTFLVLIELVVTVMLAYGLSWILRYFLGEDYSLPLVVDLLLFSIVIGTVTTQFMGRWVLDPIKKLSKAMQQVAAGDFELRLSEKSGAVEIREINKSFNLMAKELGATEVLQTDFVSNVSHEFKTPINAIEGYATLLQDSENIPTEERAQYVDKILFNTRRLSHLVGNILLLSKIDNQAIKPKQQFFRLDEQIRQVIVLLEPEWVKKDIEFDVDMEDVELYGSENLLYHVWYNLIGNAVKFNPPNGMVRIRLTQKGTDTLFEIEDTGPGINEQSKQHIFDKFYQEDSSHKEEGNGLGLALSKKIVQLAGGEITADNLPGGGCRFTVTLPVS